MQQGMLLTYNWAAGVKGTGRRGRGTGEEGTGSCEKGSGKKERDNVQLFGNNYH